MSNDTSNPLFLVCVSLLFSFLGIALSWLYQKGMDKTEHAILYLLLRWSKFVQELLGHSISKFDTEFCVPPIIGSTGKKIVADDLDKNLTVKDIGRHDGNQPSCFQSFLLSMGKVIGVVWFVLFLVVLVFNIPQCFQ